MQEFKWSYQELLDTPKVIYDWAIDILSIDAQKAKADQASVNNTNRG